jgi:hypothetical protein
MKTSSNQNDSARKSYVAMFRAAPEGVSIFVEKSPSWCTSIARESGREITTHKILAISKRESITQELTKVSFAGQKAPPRRSRCVPDDPRQILIPGVFA